MSVIGNNLANVNTNGFKTGRVSFADILSQSLTGGTGEFQIGRGVELTSVSVQFAQGSFEVTSSPTDLAIDGDGFFVVTDPNGIYYTRAGMYFFNDDGDLVNPSGCAIQGWRLDSNGEISGTLGNINIGAVSSAPNATSDAYLKLNLDSGTAVPTLAWDDQDPHGASNYSTSLTIYDSLGRTHSVTSFFRKTSSNAWSYYTLVNASEVSEVHHSGGVKNTEGGSPITSTTVLANIDGATLAAGDTITFGGTRVNGTAIPGADDTYTWAGGDDVDVLLTAIETAYSVAAGDVTASVTTAGRIRVTDNTGGSSLSVTLTENVATAGLDFGVFTEDAYHQTGAAGTLTFTTDGALDTETATAVTFNWTGGATVGSVQFDFGDSITTEGGTGLDGTTQFAGSSAILFQSQDGYSAGHLVNLSVNTDGEVTGLFSNGTSMSIYQLALANFASPWKLNQVGKNLFIESAGSGQPVIGVPNTSGLGKTASNSLEMSNVDIATEFVNLIKTQQAFQANSRIITTTDQMLQELINLKR